MARDPITIDRLEQVAKAFETVSENVSKAVSEMRKRGMPEALLHYQTVVNTRVPELLDWSVTLASNVNSQLVAWELGVASQSQIEKDANDRRKKKSPAKARKSKGQ